MAGTTILIDTIVMRKEDVETVEIDGELGMLNVETGQYCLLSGVGPDIWELIEKPVSVEKVLNTLMGRYAIDRSACENEVLCFIETLYQNYLIDILM